MNYGKADDAFSIFIRQRDADEDGITTCITCRTRAHWSEMTCGHYIKRRHLGTRWNEENCHAQCWQCNGQEERDLTIVEKHYQGIISIHGSGVVARLVQAKNMKEKLTQDDVDVIEKKYKQKVNELQVL